MQPSLICIAPACRASFSINEVIYNCPKCGGLLEAKYDFSDIDVHLLKRVWRERRMENNPLDQSGVRRYRELFPFGLTVADLSPAIRPVAMSLQHVAARQELRALMTALGISGFSDGEQIAAE